MTIAELITTLVLIFSIIVLLKAAEFISNLPTLARQECAIGPPTTVDTVNAVVTVDKYC